MAWRTFDFRTAGTAGRRRASSARDRVVAIDVNVAGECYCQTDCTCMREGDGPERGAAPTSCGVIRWRNCRARATRTAAPSARSPCRAPNIWATGPTRPRLRPGSGRRRAGLLLRWRSGDKGVDRRGRRRRRLLLLRDGGGARDGRHAGPRGGRRRAAPEQVREISSTGLRPWRPPTATMSSSATDISAAPRAAACMCNSCLFAGTVSSVDLALNVGPPYPYAPPGAHRPAGLGRKGCFALVSSC